LKSTSDCVLGAEVDDRPDVGKIDRTISDRKSDADVELQL
jgi:hypothetical protein